MKYFDYLILCLIALAFSLILLSVWDSRVYTYFINTHFTQVDGTEGTIQTVITVKSRNFDVSAIANQIKEDNPDVKSLGITDVIKL